MEDMKLQKIAVSGPTLASMIQRFSSSSGDVDGFIFGHVTQTSPSTLSDDSSSSTDSHLVATITGFICSGIPLSFYNSLGRVDSQKIPHHHHHHHLIGWFSGRRHSALRPSLREFSVSSSLSRIPQFHFPVKNETLTLTVTPCIFILFTTPLSDHLIHTQQYRAFQFDISNNSFQPKTMDVVNIGPGFRGHYGNFEPNCALPFMNYTSAAMDEESVGAKKEKMSDQKQLDSCTEGFQVENLRQLMGPGAASYTGGLEDLYEKMLSKVESLAPLVESSSSQVLELENNNRKLRCKVARSAGFE